MLAGTRGKKEKKKYFQDLNYEKTKTERLVKAAPLDMGFQMRAWQSKEVPNSG